MSKILVSERRYVPRGAVKIADKQSDAVAYVYDMTRNGNAVYGLLVYYGNQSKAVLHQVFGQAKRREDTVKFYFTQRQNYFATKQSRVDQRKQGAADFQAEIKVGDIFHYQYGYDETHHVFHQITKIHGKHVISQELTQSQEDLGYDWRYRCRPNPNEFTTGKPIRSLIQDGYIRIDKRVARRWNTGVDADGQPTGPSYTGGGSH